MEEESEKKDKKEDKGEKPKRLILNYYDFIKQIRRRYHKLYEVKRKTTNEILICKRISISEIENVENFETDLCSLIKIEHPNLIKLVEFFKSKNSYYLIYEKCNGSELFENIVQHIENEKMYSEKEAAKILRQIISAVEYCHNNDIEHNHINPEKILYLKEGAEENNPIKINLGLRQLKHNYGLMTKPNEYYIPPEIIKGSYSEKSDIWSAGVILYILLSGRPPFNGYYNREIFKKISEIKYDFPNQKWEKISNNAKDLIQHMIAQENERFNVEQVLEHPWMKSTDDNLMNYNFDSTSSYNSLNYNALQEIILYIESKLEEKEIIELRKILEDFDLKKEYKIPYEELKKGLLELKSKNATNDEISELFKNINVDKNEKIHFNVFLSEIMQRKKYLRGKRLSEAFSIFDNEGCGKITKEDFMKVSKDETIKEEEIKDIIDESGEEKINYKEFLKKMGYDTNNITGK